MEITYAGRTFSVEATGVEAAPFRLVGQRGATFTLVATSKRQGLYWVKAASGRMAHGTVGTLADGRLVHLTNGPDLAQWRSEQTRSRS